MSVNGLLTQVQFVTRGSELTAAASVGATVLTVDSTVDFDDAGGDLEVNGLRYEYVAVDVGALTITLATTLTVAVAVDDFVASVAGGQVEVDAVAFVTHGEGDDAEVNIALALRPLLPEGVYDDVPVLLTDDLESIEGFPGRTPVIEGTTFQTASEGQRIIVRNDDSGGLIESFSGTADETDPGVIDPNGLDVGGTIRPTIVVRSGKSTTQTLAGSLTVFSGSGSNEGGGALVEGNAIGIYAEDLVDITTNGGVINLNSGFGGMTDVNGPLTASGSIHGDDLYSDGQAGVGTIGASLTAQGRVIRTPSTRKVKKNIKRMTLAAARKVLDMQPVTFNLRAEKNGPTYPGFIAEQAAEVGAELWVSYDADGEPAGIRYAEVSAAHNLILTDQQKRIDRLEQQVAKLTARLNRKETR